MDSFQTNFTIMPKDANYMYPMVFGGALYSEMDLCAAKCVDLFLVPSECKAAVTHKSKVEFMKPTYVGDTIYLYANVVSTGKKSVVVFVSAYRNRRGETNLTKVAEGEFIFVSVANTDDVQDKPELLPYKEHGLNL